MCLRSKQPIHAKLELSHDVVLITHLLMTQAWTGDQWEGPGMLVVSSQVHLVDFELVARGEEQGCLHGLDESCDQTLPLLQTRESGQSYEADLKMMNYSIISKYVSSIPLLTYCSSGCRIQTKGSQTSTLLTLRCPYYVCVCKCKYMYVQCYIILHTLNYTY